MHTNQLFKLEMFQDLDKNKYIHPFHQTNRGHLIIAGDHQFKNDYILGYILRRLPNQYNEKEVKIIMHSSSIGEIDYPMLEKYLKKPISQSKEQLIALLKWVRKTMNNRYKIFNTEKAKDIYAFNQKVLDKKIKKRCLPHLLILIHEVPQTDDIANDPINKLIHEIIQKSRASGIHLIISSSTIRESISPILKYHMDGIIFTVDSVQKSKILIGNGAATKIKPGKMMIRENMTDKNTIFKLFDDRDKRNPTFAPIK